MNLESTDSSRVRLQRSEARATLRSLAVAWAVLATIGFVLDGVYLVMGRIQADEAAYTALCVSSLAFIGATGGRAAELSHPEASRWIKWLREPLFGLVVMFVYSAVVIALGLALAAIGIGRALLFLQPLLLLIFPVYLAMSIVGRRARKRLFAIEAEDQQVTE